MKTSKILRVSAPVSALLVVAISACCVFGKEKTATPVVRFHQITTTSVSKPLRNPHLVVVGHGSKSSVSVLWRAATKDKSIPGQVYYEPRSTHWTILGAAQWSEGNAQVLDGVREYHFGQYGDAGGNFSVILPSSGVRTVSKRLTQPFLIHPFYNGGGSSSKARIAVRSVSPDLNISTRFYSEVPANSREPKYLAAVKNERARLEQMAKESGKKVIDATNLSKAEVGDLSFRQSSVGTPFDYFRFKGTQIANGDIWIAGIDQVLGDTDIPQKYTWVFSSSDGGKSWGARTVIGRGNYPTIAATSKELLVFSTATAKQFGYKNDWPEVDSYKRNWPGTGTLAVQRSRDNGKTWGKNLPVLKDDLVIQNSVCVAPDGRIHLVYVQSDPMGDKRTSLWLISSGDNAKTWTKPQRLTDGKTLDREPDIVWHKGKLLLAFSRGGRGINTDIWLAEIDAK